MKKLFILVLFLLILPFAYSAELFSGSVEDGEFFNAGSYECYVKYNIGAAKLYFQLGQSGRILVLGECSEIEDVKICYEDMDYDNATETPTSFTVSVNTLGPSITIERSFSSETVDLGEEIDVEVTITNDGEKSASDVEFTDTFPEN